MICIKKCAIEKECRLHSLTDGITLPLLMFYIIYLYIYNHFGNLAHISVMEKMLYWTVIWKIKISLEKIIDIKEQLILQIVPRQVHSWWLCHHLSEKEAAVASCSLATIYQRFNDLGFSYPQPVDVLGLG